MKQIFFLKKGNKMKAMTYKMNNKNFSCICPVINDGFSHNIVKVAVDLRGDNVSRLL